TADQARTQYRQEGRYQTPSPVRFDAAVTVVVEIGSVFGGRPARSTDMQATGFDIDPQWIAVARAWAEDIGGLFNRPQFTRTVGEDFVVEVKAVIPAGI